jgi:hypothetical protein
MPQWEYCKIDLNDLAGKIEDIDLLNDAGVAGWELVSITLNSVAFLKRLVPQSAAVKSTSRRAAMSTAGTK